MLKVKNNSRWQKKRSVKITLTYVWNLCFFNAAHESNTQDSVYTWVEDNRSERAGKAKEKKERREERNWKTGKREDRELECFKVFCESNTADSVYTWVEDNRWERAGKAKEKKEGREERNWNTGKREDRELVCFKVSVFQASGEVFIRGNSSEVIDMPDKYR